MRGLYTLRFLQVISTKLLRSAMLRALSGTLLGSLCALLLSPLRRAWCACSCLGCVSIGLDSSLSRDPSVGAPLGSAFKPLRGRHPLSFPWCTCWWDSGGALVLGGSCWLLHSPNKKATPSCCRCLGCSSLSGREATSNWNGVDCIDQFFCMNILFTLRLLPL